MVESSRFARAGDTPFVESLGGGYCRVHLSGMMDSGLSASTLYRLFALSANAPAGNAEAFRAALCRLESLVESGALPLDAADTRRFLVQYRAAGCPATHHSERFRQAYAPAYRVVSAALCRWLLALCGIDRALRQKPGALVAIEGGSATGKTSLAALLQTVYDCNVFHTDDFFLQAGQRTPERYATPGGNVDHERLLAEVVAPLRQGAPVKYRPFDCGAMALGEWREVAPKRLNVVEGAYSMHPSLADAYDFSVFLTANDATRRERILHRNGADMLERFVKEWIPLEDRYFEATRARERCAVVLDGE